MSTELLSKYRSEIMGFAAIWIICYHFTEDLSVKTLDFFSCIGYGGVDIFLFLSGFGLTIGYKYQSILDFYKRRLIRIYPTYLIILVLWYAIRSDVSIKDALVASTGIGFYFPRFHNWTWYVPFMYLLYLIFPLWILIINRSATTKKYWTLGLYTVGACALGLLWTAYLIKEQSGPMIILAVTRIPIFFIGSLFGVLFINKTEITKPWSWTLSISAIIAIIALIDCRKTLEFHFMWINCIFWLPFIIIVPGLSLLLSKAFFRMPRFINQGFKFIGSVSLEIYLIHSISLHYLTKYGIHNVQQHPYLWLIVFICFSAFASKIYQMAVYAMLKKLQVIK